MVGFNRRWSPAVPAAQRALAGVASPKLVVYRVAAGPVPDGHWYHDRRQGGRLLGEVCHFVDTAQALIGAADRGGRPGLPWTAAAAARGAAGRRRGGVAAFRGRLARRDRLRQRPPRRGKEWIEVHAGSHRVVINDFRSAEADGKTLWKGRQDKGHRAQAAAFRQAVSGGSPCRPRRCWPRCAPRSRPPAGRAAMNVIGESLMRPRLGIVAHAPIQYHTPLFQLLAKRRKLNLHVLFLSDRGLTATMDRGFGFAVAWDIDLLSGYAYSFLETQDNRSSIIKRARMLADWVPSHDVVVVNGYTIPWILLTMAICRIRGVPYLLRGSSHPEGPSTGLRRHIRRVATRLVVAGSSGVLAMGHLNKEFYRQTHARSVTFAPNSIDDDRFGAPPSLDRSEILAKWNLKSDRPVILFSGKLIQRKRPLDLIEAVKRLPHEVSLLFVGDGKLAKQVQGSMNPTNSVVTGFINQSESSRLLPRGRHYRAAKPARDMGSCSQ